MVYVMSFRPWFLDHFPGFPGEVQPCDDEALRLELERVKVLEPWRSHRSAVEEAHLNILQRGWPSQVA